MDLARNLRIDSVSRLNPTRPIHVPSTATVVEAVEKMRENHVGCILVCDNGRLAGIFTERDLMRRVLIVGLPLTTPIGEVMTPNPVTVHEKDPVAAIVRRMEEGGYRHLPVLDERNKPVGMVSVKRVIRYLVEHFPSTVYNQPPDPAVVPQQPEGA